MAPQRRGPTARERGSGSGEPDGSRPRLTEEELGRGYRVIAELLLHPADRDPAAIETGLEGVPGAIREPLRRFREDPAARSTDEYVQTLELSPPCPLYLGAYLFDEPETCRGAGLSGRNGYMLELTGIYRHFGLEPGGRELPDFLPAVVEFLGLSLGRNVRRAARLRRLFLESYVAPALPPLGERLVEYGSPYAALVEGLETLVRLELEGLEGVRPWEPAGVRPARRGAMCRDRLAVRLPVVPTRTPAPDLSTGGS